MAPECQGSEVQLFLIQFWQHEHTPKRFLYRTRLVIVHVDSILLSASGCNWRSMFLMHCSFDSSADACQHRRLGVTPQTGDILQYLVQRLHDGDERPS